MVVHRGVKHFSCLNELSSDETNVLLGSTQSDDVKAAAAALPSAITAASPKIDNYQSFLPRVTMDGITITGVRAAESIQRLHWRH